MKQLYLQSFKLKATSNNRNMKDVKDILDEAQEKMDMAVMYLEESLAHIRAGKPMFVCWTESVSILTEAWFPSTT